MFSNYDRNNNYPAKLLKKHVYNLRKNGKAVFHTERNIIHPVDRKVIKSQLRKNNHMGSTRDGKLIYFVDYASSPDVIKEISRLREITFRKVGEGTGRKADKDRYDQVYRHLVLWDEDNLEIAGSYRIGFCREIIDNHGTEGLYSSTLFNYSELFESKLKYSLELGRSFVQAKYWNTNALTYLWQGLGKILMKNPDIQYLFGAVSLSNSYLNEAKELIVFFYKKWFPPAGQLATAKNGYRIPTKRNEELGAIFSSGDFNEEFRILKKTLRVYGYSVPTLFKQYCELCEPGGVEFIDFGIDNEFQNCLDGLIILDVEKIKESKKRLYIYSDGIPVLKQSSTPVLAEV